MPAVHERLLEIVVEQTPRAMVASIIVSVAYCLIFSLYIPFTILTCWFITQLLLAKYRNKNANTIKLHVQNNEKLALKKAQIYYISINLFQSLMWAISSLLVVYYAPQPYEFVMFILIVGIITAATLSMSSFYKAYLIYAFSLMAPQIAILLYYAQAQHISLIIFLIIYIPVILLLSKAMLTSRISSIEAHDELTKVAEEYRQLSITDTLTNVYNRRYFFEIGESTIDVVNKLDTKATLLMLDIDHFKSINDNYGHLAGDFILSKLASFISGSISNKHIFARVGGEEFAILFNGLNLSQTRIEAEKIRTSIDKMEFEYGGISLKITLSMGLCESTKLVDTFENIYKLADDELYNAKNNGRNTISPQ